MKFNLLYTIFALALLTTISLSNSGGRAEGANRGNTGAPGDEMIGNNPRTCQNCHATGAIQVTMSLEVLDVANNPITAYVPNEIYTAKVRIESAAGPAPLGYGFQMVNLFDADNTGVNNWTETGHSENVQIETVSSTNRTGAVSFYAIGSGVNRNGSTSGDGTALPQKLTLTESLTSSIADLSTIGLDLQIAPNPVKSQLLVTIKSETKRRITIKVMNAIGQVFQERTINLLTGTHLEQLDLSQLSKGIYFLQTTSEKVINTQKIIKL